MANPAIDELIDADGRLDRAALRSILPYGDAFLFVDEVTSLSLESVEASFTIPGDAAYIQAHFRGLPLMPGVLIGEGMAQAGTVMVRYNLDRHQDRDLLAFQIESARFSSPAQPGDRLDYSLRLLKLRRRVARLEGETRVGEREVCKARIVLGIVDRESLRTELETLARP
jgi:3-hydroxyacyl-[acyl-carrier-protein] dehydratase